jgi:hypothetical protein
MLRRSNRSAPFFGLLVAIRLRVPRLRRMVGSARFPEDSGMTRSPVADYCVFYRSTDIPPKIAPKAGRPLMYEQMWKSVCEWFVSGKDIDGDYAECGPFKSYDAARAFAGRT